MSVTAPVQMLQRRSQDSFFNMKALAPRPTSTATEMYDTDFEDGSSEIEEDYSPRLSMNSAGRRSETTLSSYEDLPTPKSNSFRGFELDAPPAKAVEGPKGPHLFRYSFESAQEEEYYLTMSPLTPRTPRHAQSSRPDTAFRVPLPPIPPPKVALHRPISSLSEAVTRLDTNEIAEWSPRQVARWMRNAGFEPAIVDKFEENDISGAVLITLKFEDLKELDIQSFGARHKLWSQIHSLREEPSISVQPPSPTEIECDSEDDMGAPPHKHKSRRKHRKPSFEDIISPLESVSIVGIEQLLPKPHKCAKGTECSRYKKQQRLIEAFHKGHPVSPQGGQFLIAGDPGNPATASTLRPFSDAQPSVVASSDALGGSQLPKFQPLAASNLASLEANLANRDPQDNVKRFLDFQQVELPSWQPATADVNEPVTPPFEMFPPLHQASTPPAVLPPQKNSVRSLPKLAIPASRSPFSPGPMERADPRSPELRNRHEREREWPLADVTAVLNASSNAAVGREVYRFGTPASDMDVPITMTQMSLGPVSRDASQSVPPNMALRNQQFAASSSTTSLARSASRASRRPSFPVTLPRLDENPTSAHPSSSAAHSHSRSTSGSLTSPHHPPPRAASSSPSKFTSSAASSSSATRISTSASTPLVPHSPSDIAHQGPMRKRRTRLLRHEWHEHHFVLRGTNLSMHESESAAASSTLESIDVDDYAIACSSLAQHGKINAALKAFKLSSSSAASASSSGHSPKDADVKAFTFQLVPATDSKEAKDGRVARRRESLMPGVGKRGKGGVSKTHHFAVRSQDERIDWMRELMLAKALRAKGEGFEISVNGTAV